MQVDVNGQRLWFDALKGLALVPDGPEMRELTHRLAAARRAREL